MVASNHRKGAASETTAALFISETTAADPAVRALIARHKAFCVDETPDGSGHAVTLETVGVDGIRYWLAKADGNALGCIGLLGIDDTHSELKTMHVLPQARGRGVGAALVRAALGAGAARRSGASRVSLETGSSEGFAASRRLYAREGFAPCAPFGDYVSDPFSYCMTTAL